MPSRPPIPGLFLSSDQLLAPWNASGDQVKRRHFLIEGQTLKLFGRRGKTYKGHVNLVNVTVLKPAEDSTAPAGALELHVRGTRSRTQTTTCILAPDHSADDLFMGLGNAVPSHVTSDDLWRRHMGSRPAVATEQNPREYRVGKSLGTGTFGKVKLAQRADGELFAIKCLNRTRLEVAAQSGRLAKEIKLLRLLNHPNVIRLHEVLHTPSEILMVMEYVDGGDLLEVLNHRARFSEMEVRHVFCQICAGVSFCHSLGVAHRDLKPENVLIGRRTPDGHYPVKVADFGLSTLMQTDEMLSTACGSPHYVAPEILTFDGTAAYDGRLSDVWSLGVMLHVMLLYKLPFEAESTQLLYKKIRQGLPALPPSLSASAASLLQGMLTVEPAMRMTLVQVVQHEWPQLPTAAPLAVSQTVDAVLDYPREGVYASPNGSLDFLSASNLFMLGGGSDNPSPDGLANAASGSGSMGSVGSGSGVGSRSSSGVWGAQGGCVGVVRRAFTFDVLPQASDDIGEDTLFWPTGPVATQRRMQPIGPLTNLAARKAPKRGIGLSAPLTSSTGPSPMGSPGEKALALLNLAPPLVEGSFEDLPQAAMDSEGKRHLSPGGGDTSRPTSSGSGSGASDSPAANIALGCQ